MSTLKLTMEGPAEGDTVELTVTEQYKLEEDPNHRTWVWNAVIVQDGNTGMTGGTLELIHEEAGVSDAMNEVARSLCDFCWNHEPVDGEEDPAPWASGDLANGLSWAWGTYAMDRLDLFGRGQQS